MNDLTTIADQLYDQGYFLIENFLSQEHFNLLRTDLFSMQANGLFTAAKIGQDAQHQQDETIRNDQIAWLDEFSPDISIQAYFSAMHSIRQTLNQSLLLGLHSLEAHFASYSPGHFYKKHVDQFAHNKSRRVSCVYYLNEAWTADFGGELKLYDVADQWLTTIHPQGNHLVGFRSDLPHEVCTTFRDRYSVAAWFHVRRDLL